MVSRSWGCMKSLVSTALNASQPGPISLPVDRILERAYRLHRWDRFTRAAVRAILPAAPRGARKAP